MSRIDWNVIRFPIIFTSSSSSSSSSITVQKSEFVILGSYFCRFVDILTLPCALAQIQKGDFVALVQLSLQGPFYMHLSAYNTLLTSSKGYRVGLQGMCNFQTVSKNYSYVHNISVYMSIRINWYQIISLIKIFQTNSTSQRNISLISPSHCDSD